MELPQKTEPELPQLETHSSFQQDHVMAEIPAEMAQEEEFDEISNLFFGKLKSIRSFVSDGATKFLEDRDEKFFNVLLKVYQESEIYTAWDKDHREFLDNFNYSHG